MSSNLQTERRVTLGFCEVLDSDELYRLKSHYFPDGKVGGKPSWLNPVDLPSTEDLVCPGCTKGMAFLAQLYCPIVGGDKNNFHRTLFVFICRNPNCSKMNDASNFRVFRCQLPRENKFYGMDRIDPELDIDVPNPCFDAKTYPHLCEICGCGATKKCAKCQDAWYCCRDHQAIDWTAHKTHCGKPKVDKVEEMEEEGAEFALPEKSKPSNPFVFPEYNLEIETEQITQGYFETVVKEADEDDDESEGEEDERELAKRMKEFKKLSTTNEISADDLGNIDESASTKDKSFQVFQKIISRYPDQIVRYDCGGKPLLATDFAPIPKDIPKCENCGANRQFELQLTPHLLSMIDVDTLGQSIDWGTVLIYTCSKSCDIKYFGYTKEVAFKQDFDLITDASQPVGEENDEGSQ